MLWQTLTLLSRTPAKYSIHANTRSFCVKAIARRISLQVSDWYTITPLIAAKFSGLQGYILHRYLQILCPTLRHNQGFCRSLHRRQ